MASSREGPTKEARKEDAPGTSEKTTPAPRLRRVRGESAETARRAVVAKKRPAEAAALRLAQVAEEVLILVVEKTVSPLCNPNVPHIV